MTIGDALPRLNQALNSASSYWLRAAVWMDFRFAVAFFVATPCTPLLSSWRLVRLKCQTRLVGFSSVIGRCVRKGFLLSLSPPPSLTHSLLRSVCPRKYAPEANAQTYHTHAGIVAAADNSNAHGMCP